MNERQHEIRERFERDVDILRGIGGHVTTGDLRAYGEQMAYAALPTREEEQAIYRELSIESLEGDLRCMFATRYDPETRDAARQTLQRLRELRKERDDE